jgi:hypothetical protein
MILTTVPFGDDKTAEFTEKNQLRISVFSVYSVVNTLGDKP